MYFLIILVKFYNSVNFVTYIRLEEKYFCLVKKKKNKAEQKIINYIIIKIRMLYLRWSTTCDPPRSEHPDLVQQRLQAKVRSRSPRRYRRSYAVRRPGEQRFLQCKSHIIMYAQL